MPAFEATRKYKDSYCADLLQNQALVSGLRELLASKTSICQGIALSYLSRTLNSVPKTSLQVAPKHGSLHNASNDKGISIGCSTPAILWFKPLWCQSFTIFQSSVRICHAKYRSTAAIFTPALSLCLPLFARKLGGCASHWHFRPQLSA